jgi:hypothetical protein
VHKDRGEDLELELPRDVLRRLDRFSRRVDRVGFEEMFLFAASPSDPDAHDDARFAAESAALVHGRAEPLDEARERGHDWVARFLSAYQPRPTDMGTGAWSRTVRTADDRSALMSSVADAITAIVTWDLLSEEDRDELLGPWARLAI